MDRVQSSQWCKVSTQPNYIRISVLNSSGFTQVTPSAFTQRRLFRFLCPVFPKFSAQMTTLKCQEDCHLTAMPHTTDTPAACPTCFIQKHVFNPQLSVYLGWKLQLRESRVSAVRSKCTLGWRRVIKLIIWTSPVFSHYWMKVTSSGMCPSSIEEKIRL